MTKQAKEYLFITTQDQLDRYCQQAAQAKVLALDTEFVRTRTLYSKLGLIQVYDGIEIALIDPTCDLDLEPFWQLLTQPSIVKVLHSCHEDLEVFKKYANRLPLPLFDTQIAGQFLFNGKVLGFGAMVAQELGITLDKGEARTNWLKRPLTNNQLVYAANDVKYLLPLYHKLNDQLQELNLQEYNLAEAAYKVEQKRQDKDTSLLFLDFGTAWQLKPRELAILQELAAWRLSVAQERDLALGFVVKDPTLITIAQRKPSDINSLKNIPEINKQELRIHGDAMVACVKRGKALPIEQCPKRVPRMTDHPEYKQAFKTLKQMVLQAANCANVPMEMVATKKQLNQWIKATWHMAYAETPDFTASWRYKILQQTLNDWTEQYALDKSDEK
ncbi:MAG: ribonuclease D [Gammaproteobacteria bacterium]|nr:ribonuclease D [Gammaproteobacteria bacterium]